jgi:geranylgeranyl diphosphate synthase type II
MGNEMFNDITPDAYNVATADRAVSQFHSNSRRCNGQGASPAWHANCSYKYNESTALLGGDVMLIQAYEYLNKIKANHLHRILSLFNKTAREVCEGQQLDMEFEKKEKVVLEEYVNMISLKTSVLMAASLKMGAVLGGAGEGNASHLYQFGLNLGIAFQVQDDYLDAFGDPEKFGKQVGGDIVANKKTFLMIHALAVASPSQKEELQSLTAESSSDKVDRILEIYKSCSVDEWARSLKDKYLAEAFQHLEDIAVLSSRKKPLEQLAAFLVQRDY